MPEAAEVLEFLFTGDTKSVDAAFDKTSAKTSAFVSNINRAGGSTAGAKTSIEGLTGSVLGLEGAFHRIASGTTRISPEFAESMHMGANATGQLGIALEALETPAGAAVAAIAAVVAIEVAAVAGLFEMAESATKAGDKLYLMSQKTGVSVENLHALEVGADLSGTSVERIVMAITMLEFRMTKTQGATKGAGKALADLHLDTQDANKALMQLFEHLGTIPEGMQRTQEAMKLMGPRMGRDFGMLVTEMGGDIEKFKQKLESMGIEMSEGEARRAHAFTVELKLLEEQWENLKRQIEVTAVPIVINWLKSISEWLKNNQEDIKRWGVEFVEAMHQVVVNGYKLLETLYEIGHFLAAPHIFEVQIVVKGLDALKRAMDWSTGAGGPLTSEQKALNERLGRMQRGESVEDVQTTLAKARAQDMLDQQRQSFYGTLGGPATGGIEGMGSRAAAPAGGKGGGKGGGGQDAAQQAMRMEQERLKGMLASFKNEQDGWDLLQKEKRTSMEAFTSAALDIERRRHEATIAELTKEAEQAANLKKPGERELKSLEIQTKIREENYKYDLEYAKRADALRDEIHNREKARADGLLTIADTRSTRLISTYQSDASLRISTNEDATRKIIAEENKVYDRKVVNLRRAIEDERVTSAEKIRLNMELGNMEAQHAAQSEENERRITAARKQDVAEARNFANQLRQTYQSVADDQLRSQQELIQHKIATGAISGPNQAREVQVANQVAQEKLNLERRLADLANQYQVQMESASAAEKKHIEDAYLAQKEDSEKQSAQRIQIIQETYQEQLHAALSQLANEVTSIISGSLQTGFEQGMRAGLQSFARGILQIIQSAAMRDLQQQILKIFDNLAGKGGILGNVFGSITGVTQDKHDQALHAHSVAMLPHSVALHSMSALMPAHILAMEQLAAAMSTQASGQAGSSLAQTLLAAIGAGASAGAGGGLSGGHPGMPGPNIPAHAEGLDFVPHDNYLASLHRGEAIIPASQNVGGKRGVTNVNINLNVPVMGGSSHATPKSRREYAEMFSGALKDAMAV